MSEGSDLHKLGEIAEDAQEIAEAAAEIAEDAAEEAIEAVEETPQEKPAGDIAGAIHDVSLEERLSDCLQRLAVVEERLTQQSIQTMEACLEAEEAQNQAEVATSLAVEARLEASAEVSSEVEEVEPEVNPNPQKVNKNPWWVDFLALP